MATTGGALSDGCGFFGNCVGAVANAALNGDPAAMNFTPSFPPEIPDPEAANKENADHHDGDNKATELNSNHGWASFSQAKVTSAHSSSFPVGSKRICVMAVCSLTMMAGSSDEDNGSAIITCPNGPMAS